MDISRYFERTLFYDRTPTADEHYERSAEHIFESDPVRSRIEARVQSSKDLSWFEKEVEQKSDKVAARSYTKEPPVIPAKKDISTELNVKETSANDYSNYLSDSDDDAGSFSSKASSTALPTALDQRRGGSDPPTYPGLPKLATINVDISKLQSFIRVSGLLRLYDSIVE